MTEQKEQQNHRIVSKTYNIKSLSPYITNTIQ